MHLLSWHGMTLKITLSWVIPYKMLKKSKKKLISHVQNNNFSQSLDSFIAYITRKNALITSFNGLFVCHCYIKDVKIIGLAF
jgi:hypothetical protein